MEDRRLRWEQTVRPFREVAERHTEALWRLRAAALGLFLRMAPEPSYRRRPPVALRIPVRPDLVTTVRPWWECVKGGVAVSDRYIHVEPTVTIDRGGKPGQVIIAEITVHPPTAMDGAGLPVGSQFSRVWPSLLAHFPAAIEAVGPFLDDPLGAFARSEATNCGVCGRTLTDPRSREQGIGPECIEKIDLLTALVAAQP